MKGFEANPEGLIDKGNSVYNIYEDYITEKNKISNTVENISASWKDEASMKYIETIKGYDEDFIKLGNVIEKMSGIMKRHGQRLLSTRDELEDLAGKL